MDLKEVPDMSNASTKTMQPFGEGFIEAFAPEMTIFIGLLVLIIVPNLGDGKFRLPLTNIRLPWFFGGNRSKLEQNPHLPGLLASVFASIAFILTLLSFVGGMHSVEVTSASGHHLLTINEFSRLFELIFFGAIALACIASMNRLAPYPSDDRTAQALYNNRRQADFYILLMTTAIGMSIVALSQDLFFLFIGLELASFSTYILVSFLKESKEGTEAGMKYFIVGSVASGVGLYGLSLLYLWSGSLQFDVLSDKFAANGLDALPLIALGFILVGFGFKVSAAPFHFAAPDAYAGSMSPIAGVLATASKAMGMVGLIRILLVLASPDMSDDGTAWLVALGVFSVVTMTWGNLAALGSTNPKRMLAYSSVAHAGYMLAALTAVGAWNWSESLSGDAAEAATMVLTALMFHMVVLVCFKLGAFLVISILEQEGGGHTLESLGGLAKREPFLAVTMFIFMLSLAGVPPLAGFMSKLLVIMGIVKVAAGDIGAALANGESISFADIHWVWYLALIMVINSAISVYYYLRVGIVMFFHDAPEGKTLLPQGNSVRLAIIACLTLTLYFGISSDGLIEVCQSAADALQASWQN